MQALNDWTIVELLETADGLTVPLQALERETMGRKVRIISSGDPALSPGDVALVHFVAGVQLPRVAEKSLQYALRTHNLIAKGE